MIDTEFGTRTIEENIEISSSSTKQYNVSSPPIFPMIPLTHVVVDNLNMFLRVADTLVDLLIGALRTMDKVNKSLRVRSLEGLTNLKKIENSLKELGVSGFNFWIGHTSKTLKWHSLTGPEKLIVFSKLRIIDLFPDLEQKIEIESLWRDLIEINDLLSARPDQVTESHIDLFEAKSKTLSISIPQSM